MFALAKYIENVLLLGQHWPCIAKVKIFLASTNVPLRPQLYTSINGKRALPASKYDQQASIIGKPALLASEHYLQASIISNQTL